MNEWTIVTVIATLVGLIAAVVRPLISLNTSITRLAAVVDELEKNLAGLTEKNSQSHARLWGRLGEQEQRIGAQEKRLIVIENAAGK